MRFVIIALVVWCGVMPKAVRSEIIHFRPDEPLFAGWGLDYPPDRPDDSLDLDLNFDGVLDINFKGKVESSFDSLGLGNTLVLGRPIQYPGGGIYQIPLRENDHIEQNVALNWWYATDVGWGNGSIGNLFNSYQQVGQTIQGIGFWRDDTTVGGSSEGYLGVQFEISGNTHYAWVYIRAGGNNGYIDEWAYESTPDTGILAGAIPEPSSLILFIIGAWGAWILRKEKNR